MKRVTFICLIVLLGMVARAQWQPDDMNVFPIDTHNQNQSNLLSVMTADGKQILSWARFTDTNYLKMQVLDNGIPQREEGGLTLVEQPGRSFGADHGMCLAADGDVLLTFEDARNDPSPEQQTDVYVYRFRQDGTAVWPAEGIKVPYHQQNSKTFLRGYETSNVIVSGDNIYVTALLQELIDPDDPANADEDTDTYNYLQVVRLDADGTITADEVYALNFPYYYAAAGPDGTLYVITTTNSYGFWAMRLGSDCRNQWTYKHTIEPLSQWITNTVSRIQDSRLLSDGSLAFVYNRPADYLYASLYVVNRLMPDGSCGMGESVYVNGALEEGWSIALRMAADNNDRLWLANGWGNAYNDNASDQFVLLNSMDKDGSYLWQGDNKYGIELACNPGSLETQTKMYVLIGVIPQNNGCVVLYGETHDYRFSYADFYAHKVDFDGNTLWRKRILEDDLWISSSQLQHDENNAYIFFSKGLFASDGLYAACIDITDDHNTTAIEDIQADHQTQNRKDDHRRFNLVGQPVGAGYKGIVIENGQKMMVR